MTLFDLALAYTMPAAIAVLMFFMPSLSRSSTYFAVTVPADFPDSDTGRTLLRRYRFGILASLVLALALISLARFWLSGETELITVHLLGGLVVMFGSLASFVHCRADALQFSQATATEHRATLTAPPSLREILPRPLWLHAVPYLLVGLACAWLALNWADIPDPVRLPGSTGTQDGVTRARTLGSVFGLPLAMLANAMLIHALMPLGLLIRRLPGHTHRIRAINRLLLWLMVATAAMGAYNGLAVLYGPTFSTGPIGMTINIALTLVCVILPLMMLFGGRHSRPGYPNDGDRTPDNCWKLGMIYFNPDDHALWVEKRFGVGYTLNFARPSAWIIITAVLLATALIIILSAS